MGSETVIGRIAALAETTVASETPLAIEMKHVVHVLMGFSLTIGVVFFAVAFGQGYDWLTAILYLIGIIVATVPEGLIAVATVSCGRGLD